MIERLLFLEEYNWVWEMNPIKTKLIRVKSKED